MLMFSLPGLWIRITLLGLEALPKPGVLGASTMVGRAAGSAALLPRMTWARNRSGTMLIWPSPPAQLIWSQASVSETR